MQKGQFKMNGIPTYELDEAGIPVYYAEQPSAIIYRPLVRLGHFDRAFCKRRAPVELNFKAKGRYPLIAKKVKVGDLIADWEGNIHIVEVITEDGVYTNKGWVKKFIHLSAATFLRWLDRADDVEMKYDIPRNQEEYGWLIRQVLEAETDKRKELRSDHDNNA